MPTELGSAGLGWTLTSMRSAPSQLKMNAIVAPVIAPVIPQLTASSHTNLSMDPALDCMPEIVTLNESLRGPSQNPYAVGAVSEPFAITTTDQKIERTT